MEPTTITLHSRYQIGRVDPRIFGGFLENMGRAVHQGVYDPACSCTDRDELCTDVLKALRRLRMTAMRYPVGNSASDYHWMDGAGPQERRPARHEMAWQSLEPNHVDTDEYLKLCRCMGWAPMITVDLGTATPEEARSWVEYCNCPGGSRYAGMQVTNGHKAPRGVGLWCLGNEMDGPRQLGHVPAKHYAIRAQQAARMMKDADKSIELVACGSCGIGMPTYMEWDRQVLEHLGDLADYISLHWHVGNRDDDTADFLAITNSIDRQIEEMDAVCRFVQAKRRSRKRAFLCFDEWNLRHRNIQMDGEGQVAPPLTEEVYNLEDALVVAGLLNSFVRHADVVRIANLAQIVNVIAPILTRGDKMLIQSIFYPLEMYSRRREGTSLRAVVDGPTYTAQTNGQVHTIDASAILGEALLHVFATNRSLADSATVHIKLIDRVIEGLEGADLLTGPGPKAANSFERPDVIRSRPLRQICIAPGEARVRLPPLSLAAITLSIA